MGSESQANTIAVSVKHLDLWPTRIWSFDLSPLVPVFEAWISQLVQLRAERPIPPGRSNRGGWNSEPTIFKGDRFAQLQTGCTKCFVHAFSEMGLPSDIRFSLLAWANIHDTGGFNLAHMHENVLLSGVFYLATPEGSGSIVLRDPRPGALMSPFRTGKVNNYLEVRIQPKPGLLLLFPNWLEHYVEPHEGQLPRIAIAMNAVAGIDAGI